MQSLIINHGWGGLFEIDFPNNIIYLSVPQWRWNGSGPYALLGGNIFAEYVSFNRANPNHGMKLVLRDKAQHHLKNPGDDMYRELFLTDITPNKAIHECLNNNYPAWISHSRYNTLTKNITTAFNFVYRPTQEQEQRYSRFIEKYNINMETTLAVCIRGTDKSKEIKLATTNEWVCKTKEHLDKYPIERILIQTDETEIKETFLKEFPEKCFFFEEIETTNTKTVMHHVYGEFQKTEFIKNIDVVCRIISKCKYLISHTGNMGCAIIYYRNVDNRETTTILDRDAKFYNLI